MKNLSNTEKTALEKALALDIFPNFYLGGETALRIRYDHRPSPLLECPDQIEGLLVAGDKDLACMKVDAISKRGLKKDFYDLWLLIKMLQAKYSSYNSLIFIKALTYFADAEQSEDFPVVEEKWEEIKKFFKTYVKELI